jgi:hypothetical protein
VSDADVVIIVVLLAFGAFILWTLNRFHRENEDARAARDRLDGRLWPLNDAGDGLADVDAELARLRDAISPLLHSSATGGLNAYELHGIEVVLDAFAAERDPDARERLRRLDPWHAMPKRQLRPDEYELIDDDDV